MTPAEMEPTATAMEDETMATRRRLSAHFTIEEFDSRDGVRVPERAIPALIVLCTLHLEHVRRMYGPVRIHSGFRSAARNEAVGGAPDSRHRYDRHPTSPAADFSAATGGPRQWFDTLDRRGAGGLGLYGGFVHVDTRAGRVRW